MEKDRRFRRNEKNDAPPERDDLLIGRNPVTEALRSGRNIDTLFVNPDAVGRIKPIIAAAEQKGIVIKEMSSAALDRMCGGQVHQGVVASCGCAEYSTVEDILAVSKEKGTAPFIIICDEIEDPHNLGAIIRTAEAAGADGIIIPKRRSASLNATVGKTSAGAASYLKVARVSNLVRCMEELKEQGVWIYGTAAEGSTYTSADLKGACAFVIGSEGKGMSRLVREKCDFLVGLPMNGQVNSLNASVAAGIFMYEVVRQRN